MAEKWIQKAIKRPGALTAKAKAAGAFKGNKIVASWLEGMAKGGGRTAKQARLAMTLKNLRKKKTTARPR